MPARPLVCSLHALDMLWFLIAGINQILLDMQSSHHLSAKNEGVGQGNATKPVKHSHGIAENDYLDPSSISKLNGNGMKEERKGAAEDRPSFALDSDGTVQENAGAVVLGLCRLETLLQSMQSDDRAEAGRDQQLASALRQVRDIGGHCKVSRCICVDE